MTQKEKEDQFVEMIQRHERLILKVCAMYTNATRSELRDLYQDAVVVLWESYGTFKGQSKPSTWIYAVTRYTMLNQMRKHRLETERQQDCEVENIAQDDSVDRMLEEVREAVAMLPPDERDIFIMWMEGFKTGEIAEVMSMTYGNVAIKLTRIKMKLRKMLNPKKEDEL